VFAPVASDPTVSRLIDTLAAGGQRALDTIRGARSQVRQHVWKLAGQRAPDATGSVTVDLDGAGEHLVARAALLDGTYREVAERLPDNTQISFDDDGRLRFAALEPEPEPASLLELRAAVNAMLPRVDLPEALWEVFAWTGADQAFASVTGGEARLRDLPVTIAALLVAHGCNVGYSATYRAVPKRSADGGHRGAAVLAVLPGGRSSLFVVRCSLFVVRQGVFGCGASVGLLCAVRVGSVCESAARSCSFSSLSLSLSG